MGQDSTESGEDSDRLIICTKPKRSDRSNAAAKVDENYEDGKRDIQKIYKKYTTRYTCLYAHCNASFNQFRRFFAHEYVHSDMRPFPCDQEGCYKAYANFQCLNQHVKTKHKKILVYEDYMKKLYSMEPIVLETPEKKYNCTYPNCSASFVIPNKLRAHQRTHTNERPYICFVEDCLKSYTNSSHLKRHVLSVHKPNPVSVVYKCTFKGCENVYKTNQSLKKHYKHKHEGLDYKCTECNAMFKKHRQLTLHSYIHTGTPDYSCKKCDKKCETEHQLRRHEKRGHKLYNCTVDNCTEGPFLLWTLYRKHMALKHRPDFICDICQRSFPFLFRLRMHKESQHNDSLVNRWSCTYPNCTQTFKEKRYLSQHVRHVHKGLCFPCPYEGCGKKFHWKVSLDHHLKLHTGSRPRPRHRKKPKKRKDCGIPKKSVATKLANVIVPLKIEKQLLAKETIDSENDILIKDDESTPEGSSSSSEESTSK